MELPKVSDQEIKELEVYERQASSVTDEAKMVAVAIHDAATHEAAGQWVAAKLGWCDRIKNGWLGQQANRIFKMHREWTGKINDLVLPVEGDKRKGIKGAVDIVIDAQLAWKRKEDKRIADENARILADAKKKDEEERLAAAEKLEAQGNKTMADAVLSQVGNFVAPIIKPQKSESVSYRKVWRIEIQSAKKGELLQMIAARPALHSFAVINEKAIEAHVKNMDGNLFLEDGKTPWPGVRAYQEDVPVYKRGSF